jgi:hypothetical protein
MTDSEKIQMLMVSNAKLLETVMRMESTLGQIQIMCRSGYDEIHLDSVEFFMNRMRGDYELIDK